MMHNLRLWLVVVGLTCLIWIAADQRVTRSEKIKVPLLVKPAVAHSMTLELVDPAPQYVEIGFRGPSRSIGQLKSVQDTLKAQLEVSERDAGHYELNLLEELRSQMEQFPSGLAVVSAEPGTVGVEVDHFAEFEVGLTAGTSDYEFEGLPQFDPPTVVVRVAGRRFGELSPTGQMITIPLERHLTGRPEGELIQVSVPVPRELDGGLSAVEVDPPQVTLRATLSEHVRTGRLPTVPILLLINKDLADQYEVILGGQDSALVTRAVTIRGPADVVAEITENTSNYDVVGYLKITREDVPTELSQRGYRPRVPRFIGWPVGIVLAEEPEPVEFKLVPRE